MANPEHLFWREDGEIHHAMFNGAYAMVTYVNELARRVGPVTVWNYTPKDGAWYSSGISGSTEDHHNLEPLPAFAVDSEIRCTMLLLGGGV